MPLEDAAERDLEQPLIKAVELCRRSTALSDLEQPAYKSTDINTPEEDTTLDEPDTEIENWEAELAADPEEET